MKNILEPLAPVIFLAQRAELMPALVVNGQTVRLVIC